MTVNELAEVAEPAGLVTVTLADFARLGTQNVNWLLDSIHENYIKARIEKPDPSSGHGPQL